MNKDRITKKLAKIWRSPLIALGIIGVTLPPATAVSTTQNVRVESSIPATAVSLDFGSLFRNAVRFIQVSNISDEEEVEIGRQINEQILSQRYQLYQNQQVQEYVSNLGQQLVESSNSRNIPFNFQVVKSDEVNAFATPGGFVYVTTGLLRTADNEAQLASVLAHEIAHINERHSIQAIKQAVIAQGIAETAGIETSTLAQIGYQLAVDLPRSRDLEYEADRVGLNILQQAGYPSEAFVNFLAQLESGGGQPEFLRTHPVTANRIEAIAAETGSAGVETNKGQNEAAYQNNVLSYL